MIWPLLSAILGIITFLPFNLYPFSFIWLVPLFIFFFREEKLWRLILGTAIFRIIFGLGTVYYALEPIFWTSSLLIFLGLPVTIWLIKKIGESFLSSFIVRYLPLIALPFLWTFFDLLQAQWSLIPTYIITAGNMLGSSPFLGLAGIGGFIALTFYVALINCLIVAMVIHRSHTRKTIMLGVIVSIVLLFGWQVSDIKLRRNTVAYNSLPNSISIAAVSTNGTLNADQFKELKQELSTRPLDFIILPENIFDEQTSSLVFQNAAKELGTYILTTYDTFQGVPALKYNSAILFDTEGNITDVHNKNRLTFAGEYWPFGNWRPSFYDWLKEKNPAVSDYALFDQKNADTPGERNLLSMPPSKGEKVLRPAGPNVLFAAPICLEIHYPFDLKKYQKNGAKFIVNPTSNRWINTGTQHFLYLANNLKKIEAVWLGLPIISSGVKDFAGIILPNGKAQLINYENTNKNYEISFGEVRY